MNHPEIIILPSFFAAVAYMVWTLATASQRKHRARLLSDFHSRLLDKLGSVKDFSDFVQTPAGARLMQDLASEPASTFGPKERILRAGQFGAVLGCLGIGLLLFSFFSPELAGQEGIQAIGVIMLSLGIGFSISAVASFRIASRLGLLDTPRAGAGLPATSEL